MQYLKLDADGCVRQVDAILQSDMHAILAGKVEIFRRHYMTGSFQRAFVEEIEDGSPTKVTYKVTDWIKVAE